MTLQRKAFSHYIAPHHLITPQKSHEHSSGQTAQQSAFPHAVSYTPIHYHPHFFHCTDAHTYIPMQALTHTHLHVHGYTGGICTHTYTCTHINTHLYKREHTYTNRTAHILEFYIVVYICIFVYVYTFIMTANCIWSWSNLCST